MISTYVYRKGLGGNFEFSYMTAIGLFSSVLNLDPPDDRQQRHAQAGQREPMVGPASRRIATTPGDRLFEAVNTTIMLLLMLATLYPFVHILAASFSQSSVLLAPRRAPVLAAGLQHRSLCPRASEPQHPSGYTNTLTILVFGTVLSVFLTTLGAYVLSRRYFRPAGYFMILIIITMYFHGGLIPRYLLVSNGLGLRNTLWALILPGAISAWNLIVMRTNFYSIPDSLEESAHIEGANDVTILFRIYVPLSGAVVAVMVLFYGVAIWNAWFDALIFIRDRAKYPLQIILREILIVQSLDSISSSGDSEQIGEAIKYATIIVATVPILLVYPFIQRYFVERRHGGRHQGLSSRKGSR